MNVLVTSGGTVAPIDDVRQITNTSTGRFGAMIAEASLRRGAKVWYLSTPAALKPFRREAQFDLTSDNPEAEVRRLAELRLEWAKYCNQCYFLPFNPPTVERYSQLVHATLRVNPIDIVFLAMAVSDYSPEAFAGKISSDRESQTIQLRRSPKVIQSVRDWAPHVYLVGFKLTSRASDFELTRQAREACRVNRADLTVANDLIAVQAGRHVIHLVRPDQPTETYGPDEPIAERLVDRVFEWAEARSPGRS